jgi:hypothetical protein
VTKLWQAENSFLLRPAAFQGFYRAKMLGF